MLASNKKKATKNVIVFLLFFLASLIIVSAYDNSYQSASYDKTQLLNVTNGSDTYYYLAINNGTISDYRISQVINQYETGLLNLSNKFYLQKGNITLSLLKIRIPYAVGALFNDTTPTNVINLSSITLNNDAGRTYSFIANITNTTVGSIGERSHLVTMPNNESVYLIDTKAIRVSNGAGATFINTSQNNISFGTEMQITVTINATEYARIYIDGIQKAQGLITSATGTSTGNLLIGNSNTLGHMLNGTIRNFLYYSKELNPKEVLSIYGNNGLHSFGANITEVNFDGPIATYPNGTLVRIYQNNLSVSADRGVTWTLVHQFDITQVNSTSNIIIDELNQTWINPWMSGAIYKATDDSLQTWVNPINMSCDNVTSPYSPQGGPRLISELGISTTSSGITYFGSYVANNSLMTENCAHFYKVDSNNVGSLIYNETALYSSNPKQIGRHVHFLQCDPYGSKCYASIGDSDYRKKIVSFDKDGTNFQVIRRDFEKGISWQPTMIGFTRQYIYMGEDISPWGSKVIPTYGTSRVFRIPRVEGTASTFDNASLVWNTEEYYSGFFSMGKFDVNGTLYSSLITVSNATPLVIVGFNGANNKSRNVAYLTPFTFPSSAGISYSSNFNNNNEMYTNFIATGFYSNYTRVIPIPAPSNLEVDYKLNHNTGNVVYDTSGNARNATWASTGNWFVTDTNRTKVLNKDIDFSINETTGEISLTNDDYDKSFAMINYAYYTFNSIYENLSLYYSFDVQNGTSIIDLSKFKRVGTYTSTNGLVCAPNDGFGNTGSAKYTGTSNSVIRNPAGNYLNLTNNVISMSIWVNMTKAPIGTLFSSDVASTFTYWAIGEASAGSDYLNVIVRNNTGGLQTFSDFTIKSLDTSGWHHVAITMKHDGVNLYIKGWVDNQYGFTHNLSIPGNLYNSTANAGGIGRWASWGAFNGTIDEVMMFNTELTNEAVEAIYLNQSKRFISSTQIAQENTTVNNNTNRVIAYLSSMQNNVESNISLFFNYYTDLWSKTDSQSIASEGTNYTFVIPLISTNVSYNVTLSSGSQQFFTPFVRGYLAYYLEFEDESTAYVCSQGDRAMISLILIVGALLVLAPLLFIFAKGKDDPFAIFEEIDIKTLLVIFVIISVGTAMIVSSAQSLGSVCGT